MTTFEIFLLIVVVVAAILGFRAGIVKQLGSLGGIVLGIVACRLFGDQAVALMQKLASDDTSVTVVTVLAYCALFIIVYFAVVLIAYAMRKLIGSIHLGIIDRLAGAAFKVVLWLFVVSLGLNLWNSIYPSDSPVGKCEHRVALLAPYLIMHDSVLSKIKIPTVEDLQKSAIEGAINSHSDKTNQ